LILPKGKFRYAYSDDARPAFYAQAGHLYQTNA